MNKSFLILPFIALGLTACNTGTSADLASAEITNAGTPAWQNPDLQQVPMPASMTQVNSAAQAVQNIPHTHTYIYMHC